MSTPNWQSPEDYKFTESLTKEGWAWEFLRRNPKYRADNKRVRDIYSEAEMKFGDFNKNEDQWNNHKPIIIDNPFDEHGDSPGTWNGRIWDKNIIPEWTYLEPYTAGMWGLKHSMQDPQMNTPPTFRYPYDHPKYLTSDEERYYLPTAPSPSNPEPSNSKYIALGFDLSLPIDKQLKKAKEILKTQRTYRNVEPTKNHTAQHLWRDYLVVLDALDKMSDKSTEKAYEDIAEFMFKDEPDEFKSNPDWLADKVELITQKARQARRMRDKGYIEILRSDKVK